MWRLLPVAVAAALLGAVLVSEAASALPAPSARTLGVGVVDAEVLGAAGVRRADGRPAVIVELLTDERIGVTVTVIRYQAVLKRSRLFQVRRPGRWAISVSLPRGTAGGRARVVVRLEDGSGATDVYRQPIVIPARAP
jgi:hypothetical protein